jgi:tetratricopeptide (TPR) repeat protein
MRNSGILGLGLAGLLAVAGCVQEARKDKVVRDLPVKTEKVEENKQRDLWERFGERIYYRDFSKMVWPSEGQVPKEFDSKFELSVQKNLNKLEELVYNHWKNKGVRDNLAKLNAHDSVMLSVETACDLLEWENVDLGEDFKWMREKHGPLYFNLQGCVEEGVGDCDKYSNLTAFSFSLLRKVNPSIRNVIVTPRQVGSYSTPGNLAFEHAWKSVLVFGDKEIYTTQIDPTFYDSNKEKLEATPEHVNPKHLTANIYFRVGDIDNAMHLYWKGLADEDSKDLRAQAYIALSECALQKKDAGIALEVEGSFISEDLERNREIYAKLLYNNAWTLALASGSMKPFDSREDILKRVNPDSTYLISFEKVRSYVERRVEQIRMGNDAGIK